MGVHFAGKEVGASTIANVDLNNSNQNIQPISGLYNLNGQLEKTWQQLKDEGAVKVVDGVLTTHAWFKGGIVIDDEVTSIKDLSAFNGINYFYIPDSVIELQSSSLVMTNSFKHIRLSENLKIIGDMVFGYTYYTNKPIKLPASVESIGNKAFGSIQSNTLIMCSKVPPTITSTTFTTWVADDYMGANLERIYVPNESLEAYKNAQHWSNYTNIIIGYDNLEVLESILNFEGLK